MEEGVELLWMSCRQDHLVNGSTEWEALCRDVLIVSKLVCVYTLGWKRLLLRSTVVEACRVCVRFRDTLESMLRRWRTAYGFISGAMMEQMCTPYLEL
ncbi:unnamed protein product [Hydatigera taeniaeformis]|uniref:Uncharacterized protein n=1 Tax=Hydatigena taeniaeformis TaxID=6205 RepID=A0A0R3WYX9_HYDTA|nr:unnamed protein product [Hydatigera taeniaeformis]